MISANILCIQAMRVPSKMDFYDYLTVECESSGQHTQKIQWLLEIAILVFYIQVFASTR